jgi:AcrR family transcriptional regulator
MARTWAENDRKAGLMARKREALVAAAKRAFLEKGYAESSVNKIAADAGVSIKTLYRHFENKDDLFSAVMQAACADAGDAATNGVDPEWFQEKPETALARVAYDYLRHALSQDQLDLYRVVTRDAHRFPELGRRYKAEVIRSRDERLIAYLKIWSKKRSWKINDLAVAATLYAGMLRGGLIDDALLGDRHASDRDLKRRAALATECFLILIKEGSL